MTPKARLRVSAGSSASSASVFRTVLCPRVVPVGLSISASPPSARANLGMTKEFGPSQNTGAPFAPAVSGVRPEVALARYRRLFEMAGDGIVMIDPVTRQVTDANPSVLKMLQLPGDQVFGKELWQLGLLADERVATEAFNRLEAQGGVRYGDLSYSAPDGTLRSFELELGVFDEAGTRVVQGNVRDLTAGSPVDQALARLAAIVESSDDAIVSKDLNGVIASWNRAAERLFGHTAEEAIGQSVTILIPEDRHDEEPSILERIRRGERIDHCETVRRRKDGTLLDISLTVSPIINSRGQVVGVSKTARDITDRRRTEAALRESAAKLAEADIRKNEFLAMLAHELRNPLAPIRNALEILRLTDGGAAEMQPASEMIDRQLSQMVRLVDDLLEVSRITRGQFGLKRERIEFITAVRNAVEAVRPLFDKRRQDLTVSLPETPVYVDGDPIRLTQIVGNLLQNACKFTPHHGHISLAVEQNGVDAILRVRDSGIGITPEQMPRIFEMFSQGDTSLERATGGLGIGLALVKQMAEMHGGSVSVHSAGRHQGSEFVVTLPIIVDPPEGAAGTAAEVPQPVSGRRILVVDDNRDAATSLAMLLELNSHETHVAHDGLAAVAAAEALRPHVVLLDIGLPGLNGREVARAIRQQPWGRDMLLVALTGWGQEEDRQKSKDAGFDRHLVKPVDFHAVLALLAATPASSGAGGLSSSPSPSA